MSRPRKKPAPSPSDYPPGTLIKGISSKIAFLVMENGKWERINPKRLGLYMKNAEAVNMDRLKEVLEERGLKIPETVK